MDWFFKDLDQTTNKANLTSLRRVILPRNDLEIRFWYSAGYPDTINGFVIRRSGERWSAIGIRQIDNTGPIPIQVKNLGTPTSGWDATWQELVDAGILTLPDEAEIKCNPGVLDGWAIVVETNVNRVYRTYEYSNPSYASCDEAKRVISISEIIAREFRLQGSR